MKFSFDNFQEFLDWNVKRENHIKHLSDEVYRLERENARQKHKLDEYRADFIMDDCVPNILKKSPAATDDE